MKSPTAAATVKITLGKLENAISKNAVTRQLRPLQLRADGTARREAVRGSA